MSVTHSNRALAFLRDLSGEAEDPPLFQRARWETQVCESNGFPHFIIDCNYAELPTLASKQDFRRLKLTIRDPDEAPVASLEGFTILARTLIGYTHSVLHAVSGLGGTNELGEQDCDTVDHWPVIISGEYLKRNVTIVKASQLPDVAPHFAIGGKVFAKTCRKMAPGWGAVSRAQEVIAALEKGLPYNAESPANPKGRREFLRVEADTEIVLSEPISLKIIAGATLEYRVWVVDGAVAAISTPRKSEADAPPKIRQFAARFIEAFANALPRHYVLDLGVCKNGQITVIELNSIMEAGFVAPFKTYRAVFEAIYEKFICG